LYSHARGLNQRTFPLLLYDPPLFRYDSRDLTMLAPDIRRNFPAFPTTPSDSPPPLSPPLFIRFQLSTRLHLERPGFPTVIFFFGGGNPDFLSPLHQHSQIFPVFPPLDSVSTRWHRCAPRSSLSAIRPANDEIETWSHFDCYCPPLPFFYCLFLCETEPRVPRFRPPVAPPLSFFDLLSSLFSFFSSPFFSSHADRAPGERSCFASPLRFRFRPRLISSPPCDHLSPLQLVCGRHFSALGRLASYVPQNPGSKLCPFLRSVS